MYRATEAKPGDEQFVERLCSLPVVTSAWGQLGALYSGTKEHNRLFRFTLGTAESGLGLVVSSARPVVAKFEKPIGSLNGLACQQLEKLERDYPIITKPTDEVLKQTAETCSAVVKPIADRVKPITDTVGSVGRYGFSKVSHAKDYTLETIDGVKTYGVGKVGDATSYGVGKVSDATSYGVSKVSDATSYGVSKVNEVKTYGVSKVGEVASYGVSKVNDVTAYGMGKLNDVKTRGLGAVAGTTLTETTLFGAELVKQVADGGSRRVAGLLDNEAGCLLAARVDSTINLADRYVDKYLPEDSVATAEKSVPSLEVDEVPSQFSLTRKALMLGGKVRRRGYARVAKQLSAVKLRSAETIEQLNFSVNLIEYARNNLEGARVKVQSVWEEVNKSTEQLADEVTEDERNCSNLTLERRAIATARHLTQRLKANLTGINVNLAGLNRTWDLVPAVVRTQVEHSQELAQSLYQTFSQRARTGLTSDDITTVRATIGHLRQTLFSVLDWAPIAALVPTLQRMVPFSVGKGFFADLTAAAEPAAFSPSAEPATTFHRPTTGPIQQQDMEQEQEQELDDACKQMNCASGEEKDVQIAEDGMRDESSDDDHVSGDDENDDEVGGEEGGQEGGEEGEEEDEEGGQEGKEGSEERGEGGSEQDGEEEPNDADHGPPQNQGGSDASD